MSAAAIPAPRTERVMVLGAGPSGLAVARCLGARGASDSRAR